MCFQMTTLWHSWPLWGCGIYKTCTRPSQQHQSILQHATLIELIELQGGGVYNLLKSSPRKRWCLYLPLTLMGSVTALVSEISCMWQTLCQFTSQDLDKLAASTICHLEHSFPKPICQTVVAPATQGETTWKQTKAQIQHYIPSRQPAQTCSSGVSHLRKWILQAEGTTSASEDWKRDKQRSNQMESHE